MTTQQIRTAEELDALPAEVRYLLDVDGDIWKRVGKTTWAIQDGDAWATRHVARWAPLTPLVLMRDLAAPAPVDQGDREALLGKVAAALIDRQACADTGKPLTARQYAAPATDAALAWFAAQPKTVTAGERDVVSARLAESYVIIELAKDVGADPERMSDTLLKYVLAALDITVQGGAE